MLTLININRMLPPIAPIGLEYVAEAVREAGVEVELVDLGLAGDPEVALQAALAGRRPELVAISVRNVDDCFWPSAAWFVPELAATVEKVRTLTDAPICLGGVGFSIFAREIVQHTGADFGIRGDGEEAMVELVRQLQGRQAWDQVPGLVWWQEGMLCINPPAWPVRWPDRRTRDMVDNPAYFRLGGQIGLETKRGCNRHCTYCADPLAKGPRLRLRTPAAIADEVQSLLNQEIDVLHLCDSEFNLPADHARTVCEELIRRDLGRQIRWYAYLSVVPFDAELARVMRQAGCVGINFTGDSAAAEMLTVYGQPHHPEDLAQAVRLCRQNGIAVMIDLILGGPGETPHTLAETIGFLKRIGPDCIGASLGMRLYPGTPMVSLAAAHGPLETSPAIRRRYCGPIDLVQPTYYISPALGDRPARLVRDLIAGDERFFEPMEEVAPADAAPSDHNYNDNRPLIDAIARGTRGAYWDILRRIRANGQ